MTSETTAFITTLPDIPRIITALAEWLSCMVCVLTLNRRLKGWKFAPPELLSGSNRPF